jgi:hypothetical protein
MKQYNLKIIEQDGNERIFECNERFWLDIVEVLNKHGIAKRGIITDLNISYNGEVTNSTYCGADSCEGCDGYECRPC